ncbi:MAG: hypothetical protein E7173_01955 [Firmicutes bacterium]|nr:hypothetical protein [Bacillota bacterium]
MRIRTVNQDFFQGHLDNSELELIISDLSEKEKREIVCMQGVFREYLGITTPSTQPKTKITTEQMLEKLSNKMNSDLTSISLKLWIKIQRICWETRKPSYDEYQPDCVEVKVEDLAELSLKVYKQADKEFYLMAKKILESGNTLVYLNDLGINNHFRCAALRQNFIACAYAGKQTYSNFSHELEHGVDDILFAQKYPLYKELPPIFFESLVNDAVGKRTDFSGLYDDRIGNHNGMMNDIFEYVRILRLFDANGRNLTSKNVSAVLGITTFKELEELYKTMMTDAFIDGVNYILSFMKAIQLREVYYNDKTAAIKLLIAITNGEDRTVGSEALLQSYERFLSELDGKKAKQKTHRIWPRA